MATGGSKAEQPRIVRQGKNKAFLYFGKPVEIDTDKKVFTATELGALPSPFNEAAEEMRRVVGVEDLVLKLRGQPNDHVELTLSNPRAVETAEDVLVSYDILPWRDSPRI